MTRTRSTQKKKQFDIQTHTKKVCRLYYWNWRSKNEYTILSFL